MMSFVHVKQVSSNDIRKLKVQNMYVFHLYQPETVLIFLCNNIIWYCK